MGTAMHFSAKSDGSLAFCVICAKQIPDRAQVCPYCGEGPFLEDDADEDAWLSADGSSREAASDPVLEAMMAIASATPKAAPVVRSVSSSEAGHVLVPFAPALWAAEAPQQAAAPHLASPGTPRPSRPRRVVFGMIAMSMVAALTGAQLHMDGITDEQRADLPASAMVASATPSPSPGSGVAPSDHESARPASLQAPMPAPRSSSESDPPEGAARTIATAPILRTHTEVRDREAPPQGTSALASSALETATVPAAAADPGSAAHRDRCSAALVALALCREL